MPWALIAVLLMPITAPDRINIRGFNTKAECVAAGKQWMKERHKEPGTPYFVCTGR